MKRIIALLTALVMVLGMCPVISFAADTLSVRSVFTWEGNEISPEVYNSYQTEHFQILWGDTVYNNIEIDETYLSTVEAILERSWDLYIDKLGMTTPTTSVSSSYDQTTPYKVNVVLLGTGLPDSVYGWAFAGLDKHEYPYLMLGPDAAKYDTVVAHEFGHAVHYAQCNNGWVNNIYLGPWWEGIANWFAEQYMYEYADTVSGINKTDLAVNYLRATHLTKMNGRGYYEAWPILQYLTENPDGFDYYGTDFVHTLLAYKPSNTEVMFWEVLDACNGDVSVYDTIGAYASHMATMDFEHQDDYNDKIDSFMSIPTLFWQQRYTMLEEKGEVSNTYVVPIERAPQAMGYNIIPLDFTAGTVSVKLNAETEVEGANWRARLVKVSSSGTETYSELFAAGETMSISATSSDSLYLTVAATPSLDTMARHTITGWADHSSEKNFPYEDKTQYPYSVTLSGATPMSRPTPSGTFRTHSNGGGKVASTASVASTAYVGPNAIVMGSATVSDNAIIDGYAIVAGNATVSDNAYVGDYAVLFDRAEVSGNARVIENACLYVDYTATDNAVIKGSTLGLLDGTAKGQAVTYGDFFEDVGCTISGGAFSGYHTADVSGYSKSYNSAYEREYVLNLRSRYEFENNLRDTFSYTDLYGVDVEYQDGCAVFDGNNYAILDSSAIYYTNGKITMSVKGEGTALTLGDSLEVKVTGNTVAFGGASVTCDADWKEIRISLDGETATLNVNGEISTASCATTLVDCTMDGTQSYIGKGFVGEIDYARVYDNTLGVVGTMEDKLASVIDTTADYSTGKLNDNAANANSAWYGWSSTSSAVTVDGGMSITGAITGTITAPKVETDKFVIEFNPSGGNAYPDHGVLDADGTTVLFAHRYATDNTAIHAGRGEINSSIRGSDSVSDTTGQARLTNFVGERLAYGNSTDYSRGVIVYSDDTRIRIEVENRTWTEELAEAFASCENSNADNLSSMVVGDAVYVVSYGTVDEYSLFVPASVSVYKGSITGFGGFKIAGGASGETVSYEDLVIHAVYEDGEAVTVKYQAEGEIVKRVTKFAGSNFPEVYVYENGVNEIYYAEGGVYDADAEVEMTNLAGSGWDVGTRFITEDDKAYKTTTENLIANSSFENGLNGWYNAAGGEAGADYFTVNDDGTITAKASTGVSGLGSLYRAWDVEIGKTYVFTYTSDVENKYHVVSQKNDISATNDGTVIGTSAEGTNYFVFTAEKEYVQINFRWLGSSNTLGNFGLYEVASAESDRVTTTIKFMNGSTEIATAVTISGFVGDVIDLTDEEIVPLTIAYGDSVYTKDESNAESYNVSGTGTVTITYTESDIQSIETVSATVIGDNLPVLPTTLTATTSDGTMEVGVEWDYSTLVEGEECIVYGTVDGTVIKAEATVNVLPESFALADSNSTTSGSGNVVYFPLSIPDEFYIEFDFVASNVKNNWIYISNNGALWGSGQIGIGTNNDTTGQLKAQPSSTVIATIKNNVNYRMFIRGDASTDTYDLDLYNADTGELLASVDGRGFRKAADSVNSINLCTNGGGAYTLKNIKVSYSGYAKAKFVTSDGTLVRTVGGSVQNGATFTVEETVGFVIDDDGVSHLYQIPETVVSEDCTIVVSEPQDMYPVLEDAFVHSSKVYGINATNADDVFVAASSDANRAPRTDADGVDVTDGTHTPSLLGADRVGFFQFPVVELEDGKAAIAHFYVRKWHGNTFSNSNTSIRMAGYAVNDDSWTQTEGGSYTSASAPLLEGQTNAMFSSKSGNSVGYITIDITEAMKAAHRLGLDTITIRLNAAWGGAYIAEREKAVAGGAYEGKAAYISVEDGTYITVSGATKVTKDGSLMSAPEDGVTIPEGSTIKMYTDDSEVVAFTNGTRVYAITDTDKKCTDAITPEEGIYYAASVGINTVDGAQVRIGSGVDEYGKVGSGSGLRFIITVDRNSTLATVTDAVYGVEITAEGNNSAMVEVRSDELDEEGNSTFRWQGNDESVFTVALTNLESTNYNRNFTAKPFIEVDGQTFYGTEVTRSIYQIAAGLLENGYAGGNYGQSADKTGTSYDEMPKVLVDVLNAYVNMVGIRLSIASAGLTEYTGTTGAYTGDGAFFEVSEATIVDSEQGIYSCKLTPNGNAKINVDYAVEYVRINNNNSKIKYGVTIVDNNDGTYTFTFNKTTAQEAAATE